MDGSTWKSLHELYEKELRYQIFKENVQRIEAFNNAGNKPYKLGINQFADLSNEEFKARNRFKGHMCSIITRTPTFKYEHVTAVPASLDCRQKGAALIKGYEDVPANNETALLNAVANQPVSVSIEASGFEFQFYSGGVFTGSCGTNLDHGVTAVGYGVSDDGTKYWLVKNSWGVKWGDKGYIRMQRDVAAKEGLCGIAMLASYPNA